jgi:hypothetical protein
MAAPLAAAAKVSIEGCTLPRRRSSASTARARHPPYYVFRRRCSRCRHVVFIGTFLQLMWEDIPITEPL